MPILNRVNEMLEEVTAWRRSLHETPELLYELTQTSHFVAERLGEFSVDRIDTGIGRSGIVAVIKGRLGDGPTIGLRADMDALPIIETSGKPWASRNPGKAHSCGHDGHTAMLLGAAKYLAETRNFKGSVALIFQPAEEGGAGAKAMIEDGLMENYDIGEIYGMHNEPGLAVGALATRAGSVMAASDRFEIVVKGRGGHASSPHQTIDPVLASAHVVVALQGIVSRETDPLKSLVITVTTTHGGDAYNVIPNDVRLMGTVRTLLPETRDFAEKRIAEVAANAAALCGAVAEVTYERGYPVTVNHQAQTGFALDVGRRVFGHAAVNGEVAPRMGAEDFSYMLEQRPGAFLFLGNGDTPMLHHSSYDFNDEALAHGISYWVALTETALAA